LTSRPSARAALASAACPNDRSNGHADRGPSCCRLPDFLAHEPGFYSGLMLSQYTADHLIVEQRILSAAASIQSIPAAADQWTDRYMRITTG
jgi:histidine ammonia-lyase